MTLNTSIYEYRNYKDYLIDLINADSSRSRGRRKSLAESVGCQFSHVTNVLSGSGHFSQEQGEAAARFFGLTSHEIEFFLLLLQFNRAGTESLKEFCRRLLDDKQDKYSNLKSRLKMADSLRSEQEARYYSSWVYGAVHVLVSIPDFRTREALSEKLNLPLDTIDRVLSFLIEAQLCKKVGYEYQVLRPLLHLSKDSPLISKHHTNWRLRTLQSLDENKKDSLHYSSVFTLSADDYPKVKEVLTKALSEALSIITKSPEKEVAAICIDMFHL